MADVTLKYKGATIGELSESGSKTLKTAGKYCEADILLEYVKSGGGNAFFVDLTDQTLWEQKDVLSGSAVGSSYEDCKTASTTRITTKELIPIYDVFCFSLTNNYQCYMLLFDENKKYIAYRGGWFDQGVSVKKANNFTKVTGSKTLDDAVFASISLKYYSNSNISPADVQNLTIKYLSGGQ